MLTKNNILKNKFTLLKKILQLTKKIPVPVILFFVAFVVYNLNLRTIRTLDSVPAALLPFSIIANHNLYLDQFVHYFQQPGTPPESTVYFLTYQQGHFFSSYPVVLPILITPLYWLLLTITSLGADNVDKMLSIYLYMEKFAASFITALSAAFMFLLLKKITSRNLAVVLTLVYAFATNTWATSSQALWQHGLSQLFIILALLTFYLAKNKSNFLYLSGLFTALAVADRYNNLVFALLLFAFVVFMYRKQAFKYLIPSLLIGALLVGYNLHIFGSIKGGYEVFFAYAQGNIIEGLSILFFDPNRGLFIYSPVTIFGFAGIYVFLRRYVDLKNTNTKNIYFISLLSVLIGILLLARLGDRSGGSVFGPRLFVDIIPFLIILMVPVVERILERPPRIKIPVLAVLTFTIMFSVFIQIVGAFYYLHTDGAPDLTLSDWRRSQIVKLLRIGPLIRPYTDYAYKAGFIKKNEVLPPQARKARIIIKKAKTNLNIGELAKYTMEITNTTKHYWPKGWNSDVTRSLRLSYYWIDKEGNAFEGGPFPSYILRKVAPGQKIDVDIFVEALIQSGKYTLKFDLQQEAVAWFNQPKYIKIRIDDSR